MADQRLRGLQLIGLAKSHRADDVLEGRERAAGVKPQDVLFCDTTAALNTPTECNGLAHAARREEFLADAVALL